MLPRDPSDKGKEELEVTRAREILRAAEAARDEFNRISAAADADDADFEALENANVEAAQIALDVKTEIDEFNDAGDADARRIIAEAKVIANAAMESFSTTAEKIERLRAEDLPPLPEPEEDEEEEEEELPPLPPIEPEDADAYFFAHNQAEYDAQAKKLEKIAELFEEHGKFVLGLLRQANGLKQTATTETIRTTLNNSIDAQLKLTHQYKSFLQDEIRRHNLVHHDKDGTERDPGFRDLPEMTEDDINKRMQRLDRRLVALNKAKELAVKPKSAAPEKSVFYSRLNEQQVFKDADNAANVTNATQAAVNFLRVQTQKNMPGQPHSSVIEAGKAAAAEKFHTEANHTVRFIGTEVVPKPGKPAIPVAFVQETNAKKTFSKQTMYLAPGDLKKLNDLPFFTRDKIAKIKEQMRFVSHAVETSLAAITTNGPVNAKNMPENVENAFAVYSHIMGYKFTPSSHVDKMSREKLEMLTRAFNMQIDEDPEFKKHIEEAIARRDAKAGVQFPKPS